MNIRNLVLCAVGAFGLSISIGNAATINSDAFFSDPSDVTINFDSLTGSTTFTNLSGVTFSAEGDGNRGSTQTDPGDATGRFTDPFTAYVVAPAPGGVSGGGAPSSPPIYVAGDYLPTPADAADMRFVFDDGAQAFGMQIIDNDFSVGRLTAYDAAGNVIDTVIIPQVSEGGSAYFGIDGEGAVISYAILDGANGAALDSTFIDDLSYRPLAPIPIPASLPLLAAGLGGLALMLRRRKAS